MRQNGDPHRLWTNAKSISPPVSPTSTCMMNMWPSARSTRARPLKRMKYHQNRSRPDASGRGRAARDAFGVDRSRPADGGHRPQPHGMNGRA